MLSVSGSNSPPILLLPAFKNSGGPGTQRTGNTGTEVPTRLPPVFLNGVFVHTPRPPAASSPRSTLHTYHVANISTAVQAADAQTILNAASSRMLRASYGVM
jgi:hypothetical protein